MQHYLDNAATTKVAPQVIKTVCETLERHYANPSSLYAPGYESEQVIESARGTLAAALGCADGEVVFTGSGTEGSNIAVLGAARARRGWGRQLVATGYEHPAVLRPLEKLAIEEGFTLTLVPPEKDGHVEIESLLAAVGPKTVLVCAMQVNNETGAVLDVARLAKAVKQINGRTGVHVDGVQGFTKQEFPPLRETDIDSYAVSGHKLHAPKGVGALYLRRGYHILAPIVGGGQEKDLRPGTENIAYIAGFAKAVTLAQEGKVRAQGVIGRLRAKLEEALFSIDGIVDNCPLGGYAGIMNFSLPGIKSETMLHFLAGRGVYVSSGSACSKGQASHTLSAMGLSAERVDSALRVSFCAENTEEDIEALVGGIKAGLAALARPGRR